VALESVVKTEVLFTDHHGQFLFTDFTKSWHKHGNHMHDDIRVKCFLYFSIKQSLKRQSGTVLGTSLYGCYSAGDAFLCDCIHSVQ